MTAFSTFIETFESDGKLFEVFVKWFLQNDPAWASQVEKIWLWQEYPDRWGPDLGIDLVFRHKNSEIWAVQAKCYLPDYYIKKSDIDSFLTESNREGIDKRLLIATTDHLGRNAKSTCKGQEKPVVLFMRYDLEHSVIDYPSHIGAIATAKRRALPTLYPYQKDAIKEVCSGLAEADRGQLIMACGTGKTFVTLWIKEQLSAQNTLVLLPSLSLLAQTLKEWTAAASQSFDVLCVCSDVTVGKRSDDDEAIQSILDIPFPVTTEVGEVRAFLTQGGNKVIFSTYQSSNVVAEVQVDVSIADFDLVVADEAHRCAGKAIGSFTTVLDEKKIRSKKRLFATATPRTYSTALKVAAEGRGVEIKSMDDESLFGKSLHTLTFGEAIAGDLLTDYQVLIVGVDDTMVAEWIANRELVATETGIETDAESLAAQVGLAKAIKDHDLTRIISFHNRVISAADFSAEFGKVLGYLDMEHRPDGQFRACCIFHTRCVPRVYPRRYKNLPVLVSH